VCVCVKVAFIHDIDLVMYSNILRETAFINRNVIANRSRKVGDVYPNDVRWIFSKSV